MKIIIFVSLLAAAIAAPGLYNSEEANLIHTEPLTAKSRITTNKRFQTNDNGGTYIHTLVGHEIHSAVPVVHTVHSVPALHTKTTVTKSNQVVNHGATEIIHAPVHYVSEYHAPIKTTVTKSNQIINHGGTAVVHAPVHVPVYVEEYSPIKTTVTKSNQVVSHGGTTVVHASVVPVHTPVVVKTGDSAITHQSSTVHETETAPLYSYHSYHY